MPNNIPIQDPIITENLVMYIDYDLRFVHYIYRNILTPVETEIVYKRMIHDIQTWFRPEDFRGGLFDFRQVESFQIGNTPIAKNNSVRANEAGNLALLPTILLVDSLEQEVRVRASLLGAPSRRKYIAKTEQDGLTFLNEWNAQHKRQFDDVSEEMLWRWPNNIPTE